MSAYIPLRTTPPLMMVTYLSGLAREIISGLASTRGVSGEVSISTIISLEDGKLPSRRIGELNIKLAVLAVVVRSDAGAGLSDKAVIQQGDGGQVGRELASYRAGRAATASESNAFDGNFMTRRASGRRVWGDDVRWVGRREGEGDRKKSRERGDDLHDEGLFWDRFAS